jgi:hypothetical protein
MPAATAIPAAALFGSNTASSSIPGGDLLGMSSTPTSTVIGGTSTSAAELLSMFASDGHPAGAARFVVCKAFNRNCLQLHLLLRMLSYAHAAILVCVQYLDAA